jgi:hypothetical protein
MAAKTPEEKALGDVEKAIKDYDKAIEKRELADQKADEARAAENRALRTLEWTARHPDLSEEFDLVEFQRSLQAPFEGDVDPVEPDEEPERREVIEQSPEAEEPVAHVEGQLDLADEDDDDPFGEAA